MRYNTFKHFVEYRLVEELLEKIVDLDKRRELKAELSHYPYSASHPEELTWPFYSSYDYQDVLMKKGIAKKISVGDGELILADIFDSVNSVEHDLRQNLKEMLFEKAYAWVEKAIAAQK